MVNFAMERRIKHSGSDVVRTRLTFFTYDDVDLRHRQWQSLSRFVKTESTNTMMHSITTAAAASVFVFIGSCFLPSRVSGFALHHPAATCWKAHHTSVSHAERTSFTQLDMSSSDASSSSATATESLVLSLSKPLGMILEEVEEGEAQGVFVKELGEAGSALAYADQVLGRPIVKVGGQDATNLVFDDVMDLIINAPETVDLEFGGAVEEEPSPAYEVGTAVTIRLLQDDDSNSLELPAKVGDNLRKLLLDNGVEVYQGMKQKLGNCGGGGQCTFCAYDVIESEGWEPRSDYEDQKLAKNPDARLSCLNNIQGPATIRKAKR